MRLIDADELLKGRKDHDRISTHLIWNAPSIDIVRCKECKKANTIECSRSRWDEELLEWYVVYEGDDWFCADGERKESDDE